MIRLDEIRATIDDEAFGDIQREYISYLLELNAELVAALRAVLLFHSAVEWTVERGEEWTRLTGSHDATTKSLCDAVRAALAKLKT